MKSERKSYKPLLNLHRRHQFENDPSMSRLELVFCRFVPFCSSSAAKCSYWDLRAEIDIKVKGYTIFLFHFTNGDITGDNHVTCVELSKPDVATLSYRRSHYWAQKER